MGGCKEGGGGGGEGEGGGWTVQTHTRRHECLIECMFQFAGNYLMWLKVGRGSGCGIWKINVTILLSSGRENAIKGRIIVS